MRDHGHRLDFLFKVNCYLLWGIVLSSLWGDSNAASLPKGVELTCTNRVQLLLEPVNSSSVAFSFLGVAQ